MKSHLLSVTLSLSLVATDTISFPILQILDERGRGVPAHLLRPLRRHLPAARDAARGRADGQRVLLQRQQRVEVLPVHRAAQSCQKEIQGGK